MRAQEAKKKAAEEGNDAGQEFAWKDTVDMVRAAAGHARQLSLLLDLVGNRLGTKEFNCITQTPSLLLPRALPLARPLRPYAAAL